MKITKRIREEAAVFCSMCACHGSAISVANAAALLYGISPSDAYEMQVARVAVRAWDAANKKLNAADPGRLTGHDSIRDDYAEAESLLRTGWAP